MYKAVCIAFVCPPSLMFFYALSLFFVNQDFLWCMMSLRGILTYSVQFGILLTSTSRAFSVEELPQSWPAAYCSFSVLLHTWSGCHVIWIVTLLSQDQNFRSECCMSFAFSCNSFCSTTYFCVKVGKEFYAIWCFS